MIRCIFLVLILAGILTGGCGEQPAPVQNAGAKTVILYSELDNKFTENLVDAFNKEQKLTRRDVDLAAWVDASYVEKAIADHELEGFWADRDATGADKK